MGIIPICRRVIKLLQVFSTEFVENHIAVETANQLNSEHNNKEDYAVYVIRAFPF